MKMMACIYDEYECGMRCLCPVCGALHVVSHLTQAYLDYSKNGPAVGFYDGWDDAWEIPCDACETAAINLFGEDYIFQLMADGEDGVVIELCAMARKLHGPVIGWE